MARLVDQFGNPIDLRRLEDEESGPTVTGVRGVTTGHPAEGLTPERLATLLREAEDGNPTRYLELAEQMEEKDLHYRSVISTRKNQVAGLEVTVEAASDQKADVEAADLIRDWLTRDQLRSELFDVLDAVGKGFSITEIMWKTSASRWVPDHLAWRDPRWFEFDRIDGRTPLLRTTTGPQPLSPYKYIQHVHKSKSGLPIRGGLARPAAWAYLFKNFDVKSWVIFAEAFGHPLRVGKYGPGASAEDKQALLRALRNIARDAAAMIPESMMLEFVEAKISGNMELFERLADWLDRQMSKAVLGQTGTTDVGQHVGTANAHEKVRDDIEAADGVQLAATLNRDLVRPMVDLNFGPRQVYPRITIFRADPEDLDKLVERIAKAVRMGMPVEASWLADKLGVPEPDKGAVLLTAEASAAPSPVLPEAAPATAIASQATAPGDRERPPDNNMLGTPPRPPGDIVSHDAIDLLAEDMIKNWRPVMEPLTDPLERLINECAGFEEFLTRLPAVAATMDPKALAEALARAAFAARLAGLTETDLA